jgi:hypothetical protein
MVVSAPAAGGETMRFRTTAMLIAFVILIAGRSGEPVPSPSASSPKDLPENFAKVGEGVYRSGQPDGKQFAALVKTY